MASPRRIEIGFDGGQVISARLAEKQLQRLRSELGRGGGWYDVETEEGTLALDLAKVAYLRLDSGPHRVGFALED